MQNYFEHCVEGSVGNKELPQLPQVRGGMSRQQQQVRMHATERQCCYFHLCFVALSSRTADQSVSARETGQRFWFSMIILAHKYFELAKGLRA